MNYNELTYYHANPFFKQDYLPDRAWYNRQPKAYPSQIPSGKDFLLDNGRKHFTNRFNHSEIQHQNILKSPERYPFQNRIAMDKTYMRSLQTIDIEGASSNTCINQSVKNKLKAREELTRRYNQSVELDPNSQEIKRRQVALKHYQSYKERGQNKISLEGNLEKSGIRKEANNSEVRHNLQKIEISDQYKRYVMQSSSNKYHKNKPIAEYLQPPNLQTYLKTNRTLEPSYSHQTSIPSNERYRQNPQQQQSSTKYYHNQIQQQETNKIGIQTERQPISYYKNQFNNEKMRNSEQYQKILKYQQLNRHFLKNPKNLRKSSPTNLSFNLAGMNIVSN